MGKFLRLLVGRWENKVEDNTEVAELETGYREFFQVDRTYFGTVTEAELLQYAAALPSEQVRPLAQLLMYDGLMTKDGHLLLKAKLVFEWNMKRRASFAFEDYGNLMEIERVLKEINSKI